MTFVAAGPCTLSDALRMFPGGCMPMHLAERGHWLLADIHVHVMFKSAKCQSGHELREELCRHVFVSVECQVLVFTMWIPMAHAQNS